MTKKMTLSMFLIIAIGCFIPVGTNAEIYKYKDKNGVVRFTDNLAEVPENQRPGVKSFKEFSKPDTKTDKAAASSSEKPSDETTSGAASTADIPPDYAEKNKDRVAWASDLDKKRESLKKEFDQLDDMRKKIGKQKGTLEYGEKVRQYNTRLEKFEKKRSAFEKEIEAFRKLANQPSAPETGTGELTE